VPHQAITVPASKWTKPLSALGIFSAVAVSTLGFAAPASAADSNEYLTKLQPRYNYLSSSQLMAAGNKACAAMQSGVPASDVSTMISRDLGVSVSAGYEISVNAINYLGC
jgi:hypothetical protein